MDRMQLLATLLEREEGRRDEAQAALRQAQQQADAAKAQGEALLAYRDEYRQRWGGQFRQGTSIELLRCYQGFVQRLDQAITFQEGQCAHQNGLLERARQLLRQRETRVAMVRKLIERRQLAARQVQERRDQKACD